MKKRFRVLIGVVVILLAGAIISSISKNAKDEELEGFRKIESEREYEQIFSGGYQGDYGNDNLKNFLINLFTLPFSLGNNYSGPIVYDTYSAKSYTNGSNLMVLEDAVEEVSYSTSASSSEKSVDTSEEKNYSTTNIQVENVDEGDQLKTDGKYIYTINNNKVNIVDASNPSSLQTVNVIETKYTPEDLLLYDNKLVVIGNYYMSGDATIIEVFDNEKFESLKKVVLEGNYETSRMINDRVIVVTDMYKYSDEYPIYKIDDQESERLSYDKIFYNGKYFDNGLTYVASIMLNDLEDINVYGVSTYTDTIYATEKNLYLIKKTYDYDSSYYDESAFKNIGKIFGIKGIFGAFDCEDDYEYGVKTKIIKLSFDKDNEISISNHTLIKGETVNQFSFDEKDDYLRLALYNTNDKDENGDVIEDVTSVVILDKNLKEVGRLSGLAKGEDIYATRFIGDRLYLVTYKNMDPLFVIDMSDNKNPKLLGQLEIPGYSTYLHPYDDNHIIGIGVDTETITNKDAFGRVVSEWTKQTSLKMALFDVSDVENPKEISKVTIGDERTTSNVLENHKALLFSKEKQIIAIPAQEYNYYKQNDSYSDDENGTDNGFIIYNINLEDGITLKGNVFHEEMGNRRYYDYNSNVVRGMFIENNLFTISNDYIKVNDLNSLKLISKFNFVYE